MTKSPERNCFAVVVNWNGGKGNLQCLASLLAAGFSEERIVFVDNGSRDGSLELVLERHPALIALPQGSNLGFGEGANRGAARALDLGAGAVYFVNNDVSLPAHSLQPLLARLLADPQNGIVGPRVLYADAPARVWCAGGVLTWRENLSTLRGHGEPDSLAWQAECEVDYVAGCALLARAELLRVIGLFDASFFAYMEDVDLCLRAKARGYRVLSIGGQHCWHAPSSATGGGYSPRRKYMQGVNSIHFLRRWAGAREWLRFLCFDVATLPLLLVVGLARGRARGVLAKALGIWHGTLGRHVEAWRLEPGGTPLW